MPDDPKPKTDTTPPRPDESGAGQPDSDADGKADAADPRVQDKKSPKGENL